MRGSLAIDGQQVIIKSVHDAIRHGIGYVPEDRLTEGHARVLLGLTDAVDQFVVVDEIIKKALSVRQTEELARRMVAPKKPAKSAQPEAKMEHAREYESRLRQALGTKVGIERSRKGGRIVIEFYSDEEFNSVYGKIVREG